MKKQRVIQLGSDHCRYALEALERRQLLSNATLYVDARATGSNNGTSWTSAYTSLVTALASGSLTGTGNKILVAQGTFKPTTGTSRTVSFTLKSGVAIYGDYAGVNATNPNLRDPVQFPTILSGDIGTAGNNSDNSNHVVLGGTANSTGILDGVTISGGNANSGTPTSGGGYYSTTGTPTINNCIFTSNSAVNGGAAYLDNTSGGATFTNCTFSGNTAAGPGGAVEVADASTFTNCSFTSNTATTSTGNGGAIYIDALASNKITGCTFASNSSSAAGGAIYNNGSAPTIVSCVFRSNTASQGGAFFGNGVSSAIHTPVIVQCVFDANSATTGGAMYLTNSEPIVTNCTFSANAAKALTGVGPAIYGDTGCTLILNNSILWGNTGGFRAQIDGTNSYVANVTYSDIQSSMDGTGNISIDPQFVDADGADNVAGTADDNLAVQPTSPVVDVGNNNASGLSVAGITTDIAGNARIVDVPTWTDPFGSPAVIDMGAYEAQPANAVYLAGPYFVAAGNRLRINGVASFAQTTGYGVAWSLNGDSLFPNDPMFVSRQAGSGLETDTLIFTSETSAGNFSVSTTVTFVPDVLYVDDSAPAGGDGTSWSHPFQTLQQALAIAAPGVTIEVGQGTYYPTSGTDRTASFVLKSGAQIEGGFAGYGAPNPDARNVSSYLTTLSGNIGSASSNTDNSYHVVTAPLADSTTVLDGFTLTAGNANGSAAPVNEGGGMYLDAASPNINNCTFTGNLASQGCGMYNFNSSPTLSGCTFTANVDSSATGGAMYNYGSSPTITNCIFTANQASAAAAIGNYASSSATLSGCTFTGNTAVSGGGAIIDGAKAATVNISNCTFNDNSATSSTSTGGAIEQLGGTLSVDSSFFRGNVAMQGGAIYLSAGTSTVSNSIFIGNNAKGQGGAIVITPTTVVANCTFYKNSAVVSGGAIYTTDVPDVINSVLWSDTAPSGPEIGQSGGSGSNVTYSDIQGGFVGANNINADPQFHSLPTAGADGVWGTSDDVAGNLRQNFSSPLVDAGNSSGEYGNGYDIAGHQRIAFGGIDMGAYEAQDMETGALDFEYDGNLTSPEVMCSVFGDLNPATVSVSDLQLYNLDTGGPNQSASWVSYDAANKLLTFGLPDNVTANYQATVSSSTMKDIYGAPLNGYAYTNLYLLPGDANRDRTVNALDFNALANSYGKAATFSEGDFDYSGTVGSGDFALLASHYGQTLPSSSNGAVAESVNAVAPTSLASNTVNLFADQLIDAANSILT